MRAKKRVTLREVAKLAEVSTAVVSYVINDGPRATSPDARRRVLDAIETLSYHPNAAARGLRMQRTHTVGYISYDYYPHSAFFAPYNAGVLTGLTFALLEKRYHLLPCPLGIGDDLGDFHELLHSGRLDGVVIRLAQESPVTDTVLAIIAEAGVPCVCIERPGAAHFGFSSLTYDDEGAAFTATSYLVEKGHRRIAHIKGRSAAGRCAGSTCGLPACTRGSSAACRGRTGGVRQLVTGGCSRGYTSSDGARHSHRLPCSRQMMNRPSM